MTVSVVSRLAAVGLVVHPDLRQGGVQSTSERVAEVVLTSWQGLVEGTDSVTEVSELPSQHRQCNSCRMLVCLSPPCFEALQMACKLTQRRLISNKEKSRL